MDGAYDMDTMMGYLGDFGKYQMFQFTLHILAAITAGIHMFSLVTVAAIPEHRCEIPDIDVNQTMAVLNSTQLSSYIPTLQGGEELDSCSIYNSTDNSSIYCNSWVYNTTYHKSSRAIEWDFVCDQRWMGAVAQAIYMFGVLTGSVVLGNMADKYGRKIIFCCSASLQLLLGVVVAFSPNYYSFLILRFLYGIFGSAGSYITGFVLTMELVGPSKRSMCGVSFQAAFAVGIMLVAGWGALIEDRKLLQIVYGLHGIALMAHWWIMDESPRWLWANGRTREAVAIVKKALKMNKSPISLDTAEFITEGKSVKRTEKDGTGVTDLFKTPNMRIKTLNVCLAWFANSLAYYGLSLSTGKMSGNPFLLLFVMGIVELPSYVITVYLMDRIGRRPLVSFNMILGGLCCVIAGYLTQGSVVAISVVFGGKFLIASSFAVLYNYSAELFPTVVRNSALGIGSMFARTAGTLTPLITLLDSLDKTLPSIIFAAIAIISGTLTLFLPETLNKSMPDTIEDGERFGKGDTFFTSCCGKNDEGYVEDVSLGMKKIVSEQMEPLEVTR